MKKAVHASVLLAIMLVSAYLAGCGDSFGSEITLDSMAADETIAVAAQFTEQELDAAINSLNQIAEEVVKAGASYWALDTMENRVVVGLDPYNDEQKAVFTVLLLEASVDPAMIAFKQAVTQEMLDQRAASIDSATQSDGNMIVLAGDVDVSRTGIAYSLENRTDLDFTYGEPWDLACYSDGSWQPVTHLPGAGFRVWTSIGYTLQSGGVQQYRQEWAWCFGELPPGRYMFIRDGWLGEYRQNNGTVYALVEFTITPESPLSLPPQLDEEAPDFINLVEYGNVTPTGMMVVIENVSAYDIEHRAQILAIVQESDALSEYWFDWQRLPLLPVAGELLDYLIQGEGFLPGGGQLEFQLDWEAVYGELPPGEYRIVLSLGGRASPPHPTGWAYADNLVISFSA